MNRLEGIRLAETRLRASANARFRLCKNNEDSNPSDMSTIKYKKARTSGIVVLMQCKRAMLSLLNKILDLRRDLCLRRFVDRSYNERRSSDRSVSSTSSALDTFSSTARSKKKKMHLLDMLRDVVSDERVPFAPIHSSAMANVFVRMALQHHSDGLTSDSILILIDAFRQREYLKQNVNATQNAFESK